MVNRHPVTGHVDTVNNGFPMRDQYSISYYNEHVTVQSLEAEDDFHKSLYHSTYKTRRGQS